MSAIYCWVVVDADNRTLVHRAEKEQALRNLDYFRGIVTRCALVLETTTGDNWQLESTERTIIDYDTPLREPS